MNTLSKEKFLLLKLMEECSEVSQRASKALQFGFDEVQEGQEKNNFERLQDELDDLNSIVSLLSIYLPHELTLPCWKTVYRKADKLDYFADYSEQLGELKVE